MDKKPFLLEIGCEEIPAGYVMPALGQFAEETVNWLRAERLGHGEIRRFATPRRLALLIEDLDLRQEDHEEEVTGPPMSAAYSGGEPTKAALGFARGHGVAPGELYSVETPKGEYLAARKRSEGRSAAEILAAGLTERVLALRFPKTMIWGDGRLRFARPIRWLVALLGDEVLPWDLGALRAGRASHGHRLLAPGPVEIPAAGDYEETLAGAHVVADPAARRERILELAREHAKEMGGRLVEDERLADTVNFLVEEPAALAGRFDESFLTLPREVVSTAMKSHQRYFSVEDRKGRLLPGFVVILNGARPEPEAVRRGNERVLQARLEDARFYWDEDRKAGLDGLQARLETVLWIEGFGSVAERSGRLRRLALRMAESLPELELDRESLDWAARYCKADLASEMIKDGKEFTLLQGYMGQEYALAEGAAEPRARAIHEHTLPRFAGDRLPESAEGVVLALADRLDAITGFWLAGFAPTGSKDPYALRRQAVAVLRLLLERELSLGLRDLLEAALAGYPDVLPAERLPQLLDFLLGRLRGMLEEEGIAPDIFDAVVDTGETRVLDLRGRALALNALRGDTAFEKLVIGARRVVNILGKEDRAIDRHLAFVNLQDWAASPPRPQYDFRAESLIETAEKTLSGALTEASPLLLGRALSRDFDAAYRRLAELGPVIDDYFDHVMVNCEDPDLRENRLAFLQNLGQVFLYFADFSRVVLEGERE